MKTVNIGLIGFGTIGSGVAEYLLKNASELRGKTGFNFKLLKIAEKDRKKIPAKYRNLLVSGVEKVTNDSDIDVVIELIGGINPAKSYIISALKNKKHVITANKALLAEYGELLFKIAKEENVLLKFEASVGGGIPIISSLKNSLIANKIESILGIVNGTSNYILTIMEEECIPMERALAIARSKGYVEKNPRLDLEGIDSAHKLAILIKLAYGFTPKLSRIYREGISYISDLDIRYALESGYRIKLLAIAKKKSKDTIEMRVHPALLPITHMLSSVRGVFNAIYIKGNLVGEVVFYGQGAGKMPTTSAVIADMVELAQYVGNRSCIQRESFSLKSQMLGNIKDLSFRYYVRFMAVDKPGVLAKISGILGAYDIGIASVTQKERGLAKSVPIVMMTHEANEMSMKKALERIERLKVITDKPVYIRVET
ncbi:MAG: homoserine dehydrogenase [Candidatus Saelkia tenebricola]|nr:homoserine dehydrogenase [Candidatus Saelkia tenebricola]